MYSFFPSGKTACLICLCKHVLFFVLAKSPALLGPFRPFREDYFWAWESLTILETNRERLHLGLRGRKPGAPQTARRDEEKNFFLSTPGCPPKGIGEAHAPLHRGVICHSDCRNFYPQPLNSTCMLLQTNGSHSKCVPESIAGLIFFSLKHLRPMRFAVLLLRPLRAVPCSRRRPPSRSKPTPL